MNQIKSFAVLLALIAVATAHHIKDNSVDNIESSEQDLTTAVREFVDNVRQAYTTFLQNGELDVTNEDALIAEKYGENTDQNENSSGRDGTGSDENENSKYGDNFKEDKDIHENVGETNSRDVQQGEENVANVAEDGSNTGRVEDDSKTNRGNIESNGENTGRDDEINERYETHSTDAGNEYLNKESDFGHSSSGYYKK